MKKRMIIFFLIVLSVIFTMGMIYVSAFADIETEIPNLQITACTLSFDDSVYIMYALPIDSAAGAEVKMLYFTDAQDSLDKYNYENAKYRETHIGVQNVYGKSAYVYKNKHMNAKNMTDVVYARAYAKIDGVEYYSNLVKYSILEYAFNTLAKIPESNPTASQSKLKELLETMLTYGAASQKYFNYNLNNLATDSFFKVTVSAGHLDDTSNKGLYKTETQLTLTGNATDKTHTVWFDNTGGMVHIGNTYEIKVEDSAATYRAEGHNLVFIERVAPTCTENGNTEGVYCSCCNIVFVKEEVLEAVDHTYDEAGLCTVCGAFYESFDHIISDVESVIQEMSMHKEIGVDFGDCEKIYRYKNRLDEIQKTHDISNESTLFKELFAGAYKLQEELFNEFWVLTENIRNLHYAVLSDDWSLAEGDKIALLSNEFRTILFMDDITTIFMPVNQQEDFITIEVDILNLYDVFLDKVTAYNNFAHAAESKAVYIERLIDNLPDNYEDLKGYNAIKAAYEALVDWTENYLEVEEFSVTANYKTMFEEIVGIAVYGETREYIFVSVDNYEKAVDAYITNIAVFEAAKEEFAALKAEMDALIATQGTDIHYWNNDIADTAVNFVEVSEKWAAYVETYYSKNVDDTTCVHNEFATFNDFDVAYSVCEQKYEFAVYDAKYIKKAINALATVTYSNGATNADAILVEIADIEALIQAYEATYCADDCLFGDSMVDLAQVKAAAQFALECVAAYANTSQADKLQTIWDSTFEDIYFATTEALVAKCESFGLIKLQSLLNN